MFYGSSAERQATVVKIFVRIAVHVRVVLDPTVRRVTAAVWRSTLRATSHNTHPGDTLDTTHRVREAMGGLAIWEILKRPGVVVEVGWVELTRAELCLKVVVMLGHQGLVKVLVALGRVGVDGEAVVGEVALRVPNQDMAGDP